MSYHLGCDFGRDDNGTLYFAPRKYIDKMIGFDVSIFGSKHKLNIMIALKKGDHPELETSEHLDQDGVQKYQFLVGTVQL